MARPAPWTAEQAREMARRSHLPGSARFKLPPQPPQDATQPAPINDYDQRRLNRVRVQLDQLDRAITLETGRPMPDGQRLNWLASAQERLAEQERILAGRPLPGSMRPTAGKRGAAAWPVLEQQAPTVAEPQPIVYRQEVAPVVQPPGWEYDDPSPPSLPTIDDLLPTPPSQEPRFPEGGCP